MPWVQSTAVKQYIKGYSILVLFWLNFCGSQLQFRIDLKMSLITFKELPSQRSPGRTHSIISHLKLKSIIDLTVENI